MKRILALLALALLLLFTFGCEAVACEQKAEKKTVPKRHQDGQVLLVSENIELCAASERAKQMTLTTVNTSLIATKGEAATAQTFYALKEEEVLQPASDCCSRPPFQKAKKVTVDKKVLRTRRT